jgi:hypothetical protein
MTESEIRLIVLRLLNELTQSSIGNEAVTDVDGDEWPVEAFDGLQFAKNVTEALNDAEWKFKNEVHSNP